MKTKLILLFALLAQLAGAQIQYIVISTGTTGGDNGAVGGAKINTNFWYLQNEILTNQTALGTLTTTNTWLSLRIDTNTAAISSILTQLASGVYETNGGPLIDSSFSSGTASYVPIANGSAGWLWTAWPATLNYDSGAITSDGSGNVNAGSFFGSLKDSGYSTGIATYIPVANGDGTWTWAAPSGGAGGPMDFDGGLITSDGAGNISANSINNTNGAFGINNNGDTGGETDPSQILMGQFSGGSPCWIVMQGQGKMSFYSGSGSFIHENYGIHEVCALGQQDNHPNWSDGPLVIGVDYATDLPGTYFPDNSLSVEGYAGFGNYSPGYQVDVTGDINFTGSLYNNGSAVILPDSSGNGGTTLMLKSQDNGTPMYLHIQSDGSFSVSTSP